MVWLLTDDLSWKYVLNPNNVRLKNITNLIGEVKNIDLNGDLLIVNIIRKRSVDFKQVIGFQISTVFRSKQISRLVKKKKKNRFHITQDVEITINQLCHDQNSSSFCTLPTYYVCIHLASVIIFWRIRFNLTIFAVTSLAERSEFQYLLL